MLITCMIDNNHYCVFDILWQIHAHLITIGLKSIAKLCDTWVNNNTYLDLSNACWATKRYFKQVNIRFPLFLEIKMLINFPDYIGSPHIETKCRSTRHKTEKIHLPDMKEIWHEDRKHCRKRRLLVTSNFSFSNNVFYLFGELSAIFIKFEIFVCKLFEFGRV